MILQLASMLCACVAVLAQSNVHNMDEYFRWKADRPVDLLQSTYTDQAMELLRQRRDTLDSITTVDGWRERQDIVRNELLDNVFAPLPATRTPLNAKETGVHQDPRGFRVENVIFESRPNFFVTASLFVPDNATHNTPAVLFASGHWALSYRDLDDQQIVILNLVRKGIIVFAYDPPSQGERVMYFDPATNLSAVGGCTYNVSTCAPLGGGCTIEHAYYGRQLSLVNMTAASVWVWDGTRALDYLVGRREVDASRVGMIGCSGGGTQSAYLSAVDERIGPATIGCYMSTFETDMTWQGVADAEQVWQDGFTGGLDKSDLMQVRAPKATLALLTTNDDCFPLQGGRDAFTDAARIFSAFNAPGNLSRSEAVGPHGYTRVNNEQAYAFFLRHFNMPGHISPAEEPLDLLPCTAMRITSTGQITTSIPSALTVHNLIQNTAATLTAALTHQRTQNQSAFLAQLPATSARISGLRIPTTLSPRPTFMGADNYNNGNGNHSRSGRQTTLRRTAHSALYTADEEHSLVITPTPGDFERWVIPSEGHCVIIATLCKPSRTDDSAPFPVFLMFSTSRYPSALQNATIPLLLARGLGVVLASVCGCGQTGNSFGEPHSGGTLGDNFPRFLGRSTPGFHAGEMIRTALFAEARTDVSEVRAAVCESELCGALLHAAVSVVALGNIGMVSPVASFEMVATTEFYNTSTYSEINRVLAYYDLPDLTAALAVSATQMSPTTVALVSPVDATLTPLSSSAFHTVYEWVERVYDAHQCPFVSAVGALSPTQEAQLLLKLI